MDCIEPNGMVLALHSTYECYSMDSQCRNCGDISVITIPKGVPCKGYKTRCAFCGCDEKAAMEPLWENQHTPGRNDSL
jgi:hypothetical protein